MAVCGKKRALLDDSECVINNEKKAKTSCVDDDKLQRFLLWCKAGDLITNNKVSVSREGSCAQYGMVANALVEPGETLFEIPRSLLLNPENSAVGDLLRKESELVKSTSGWVPLLLAIIYETQNPGSRWRPYLDLLPNYDELDLPMFWNNDELQRDLRGTGIAEAVERDLDSISKEFNDIALPFMRRHPDLFPSSAQDIMSYKKAVAFVMAYSFTEPSSTTSDDDDSDAENDGDVETKNALPMLVPVADILNHVAKNNAHLDFGVDTLKMVATKEIKAGEEVFNTYGELANWQLLHMYGFSERHEDNHFDAMEWPMDRVFKIIADGLSAADTELMQKKWQFLRQIDVVTDGGAYVLGVSGLLTEEEMYHTLKVLAMSEKEFDDHRDKEGWSDAEEDSNDESRESMSFADISKLPTFWKDTLKRITMVFLNSLASPVTSSDNNTDLKNARRRTFAQYVNDGQKEMLTQLLTSCS